MKYMLDTNMIVFLKENTSELLKDKINKIDKSDMCISAITYAELEYGIEHSMKKSQNRIAIMLILSGIQILPFDALAAIHYGNIRQELTSKGNLIGANDMLIAAHARSQNLTLITNNTREFQRVNDLLLEDWSIL